MLSECTELCYVEPSFVTFFPWPNSPQSVHYRIFIITLRHTTLSRITLDEWSARRRDLYLTTHNTHNRQPSTWQHTTPTTDSPLPDNTQHPQQTDIHASGGNLNWQNHQASGHRDWRSFCDTTTPLHHYNIRARHSYRVNELLYETVVSALGHPL
jgi:hypothetical protein